ncbi:hypothetical protein D3C76_1725620 [compost metagenome]
MGDVRYELLTHFLKLSNTFGHDGEMACKRTDFIATPEVELYVVFSARQHFGRFS